MLSSEEESSDSENNDEDWFSHPSRISDSKPYELDDIISNLELTEQLFERLPHTIEMRAEMATRMADVLLAALDDLTNMKIPSPWKQTSSCLRHLHSLHTVLAHVDFFCSNQIHPILCENDDIWNAVCAMGHALWDAYGTWRFDKDIRYSEDSCPEDLLRYAVGADATSPKTLDARRCYVPAQVRCSMWLSLCLHRRVLTKWCPVNRDASIISRDETCAEYLGHRGLASIHPIPPIPWSDRPVVVQYHQRNQKVTDAIVAFAYNWIDDTPSTNTFSSLKPSTHVAHIEDRQIRCPAQLENIQPDKLTLSELWLLLRHINAHWLEGQTTDGLDSLIVALWDRTCVLIYEDTQALDDLTLTKLGADGERRMRRRCLLETERVLIRHLFVIRAMQSWKALAQANCAKIGAGLFPEGFWRVHTSMRSFPRMLNENVDDMDKLCNFLKAIVFDRRMGDQLVNQIRDGALERHLLPTEKECHTDNDPAMDDRPSTVIHLMRPPKFEYICDFSLDRNLPGRIASLCGSSGQDCMDETTRNLLKQAMASPELEKVATSGTSTFILQFRQSMARTLLPFMFKCAIKASESVNMSLDESKSCVSHLQLDGDDAIKALIQSDPLITNNTTADTVPQIIHIRGDYWVVARPTETAAALCVITPRLSHALLVWCAAVGWRHMTLSDQTMGFLFGNYTKFYYQIAHHLIENVDTGLEFFDEI